MAERCVGGEEGDEWGLGVEAKGIIREVNRVELG
jgi:hypothetical protein